MQKNIAFSTDGLGKESHATGAFGGVYDQSREYQLTHDRNNSSINSSMVGLDDDVPSQSPSVRTAAAS